MKIIKQTINLCIIPFLCILPVAGLIGCSTEDAACATSDTIEMVGDSLADLPDNLRTAAPDLQKDLETLWNNVSGTIETCAQDIGISEPHHPLAEAQHTREKLIAGASFNEVAENAMNQLTTEDLENMPVDDLSALNGILPFDIDLEACGENLAVVLNSLDIGQVSAILKSDIGYHLIQLIDRDGGRVKIGHVVFEIDPTIDEPEEPQPEIVADEPDPIEEALARLANVLGSSQ